MLGVLRSVEGPLFWSSCILILDTFAKAFGVFECVHIVVHIVKRTGTLVNVKAGWFQKKKEEELFGIVNQKGTAQGGRTISERASDQYWAFRRSFERDENGEYKLLQIEHLCA